MKPYFANILETSINGTKCFGPDDVFVSTIEEALNELSAIIKNGFEHEFCHTIFFDGEKIHTIDIYQEAKLQAEEDLDASNLSSFQETKFWCDGLINKSFRHKAFLSCIQRTVYTNSINGDAHAN